MSKLGLYTQAIEHCIAMARSAGEEEIRLMWLDLADDYRYLLDLERYSSTPRPQSPRRPAGEGQSLLFNNRSYSAAMTR